jgi:SAM-dependent methyltransferase
MAEAWGLLRGDTSTWTNRPFYRAVIAESGEPALDAGCGTGRLLLDYLAEGLDIDGVDVSPELLAIYARKASKAGLAPNLFRQSIEPSACRAATARSSSPPARSSSSPIRLLHGRRCSGCRRTSSRAARW